MRSAGSNVTSVRPEDRGRRWMNEGHEPSLVSVIVPTLNRACVMEPTLRSVLEQEYRPIEVVVVDDGSTDGTREWVGAWRKVHETCEFRIRYVAHQANLGLPAARNTGLRVSRGEFIQFLDSDDLLRSGKLSTQARRLRESPSLDYVYGRTHQVERSHRVIGHVGAAMDVKWPGRNIPGHHWHVSSPLYRRRVCVGVGPWNEQLRSSEDWEYAARVKSISQRGEFLPDIVSYYVVHGGKQMIKERSRRVCLSRRDAIRAVLSLLDSAGWRDDAPRDMCARALVANAIAFRSLGDPTEMRRTLLEAIRTGGHATRIAARGLYFGSFLLPSPLLDKALRIARRCRHSSA